MVHEGSTIKSSSVDWDKKQTQDKPKLIVCLHNLFTPIGWCWSHTQKGNNKRKRTDHYHKQKVRRIFAYPADDSLIESCGKGGIGEPPLSSDGVLDKNKLPPISETNVMGEL